MEFGRRPAGQQPTQRLRPAEATATVPPTDTWVALDNANLAAREALSEAEMKREVTREPFKGPI